MNQVLPLQDGFETEEVYQYLTNVRKESQQLQSIAYIERPTHQTKLVKDPSYTLSTLEQQLLCDFQQLKQSITIVNYDFDSNFNELPQSFPKFKKNFDFDPPSIQYFYNISRVHTFKLLHFITKLLSINTAPTLSKWIWSLLVRIDSVIDANECSLIRDLGKKAIKIRNKCRDSLNNPLNPITMYTTSFIIIIVGKYFGQHDLLLNAT
ncbi:unnamed protein product [Candida verbasci]|uniref:Uncharacterized protein n=1 Tax=Candida verbasci TaxID=1227364 RepID=A0A9W4XIV0_9ASCO|nr:unnamed protein product [Candida verbasci]